MISDELQVDNKLRDSFLAEAQRPDTNPIDEQNAEKQRIACAQVWNFRIMFDGNKKKQPWLCQDYRRCDNCRYQYYLTEIENRLHYAQARLPIGQWLKFIVIEEGKIEVALLKRITRHDAQYKRIPQPNNMVLIIHNALDFQDGKELIDYDYIENIDDWGEIEIQLEFNSILQNIPEGKYCTGTLGKKPELPPDKDGEGSEEDEEDEYEKIKIYHLHPTDEAKLTERFLEASWYKAIEETQNIDVHSFKTLEKACFQRIMAWKKALGGNENILVFHSWENVNKSKLVEWNNNPNNGVANGTSVQISPISSLDNRSNTDTNYISPTQEEMDQAAIEWIEQELIGVGALS